MKHFRKLIGLLMAMILVFSLSAVAFADGETPASTPYTVTFLFGTRDVTSSGDGQFHAITPSSLTVIETSGKTIKECLIDALGTTYSSSWGGTEEKSYLNSISFERRTYGYSGVVSGNTYTGSSWMWDYDLLGTYPDLYMSEASLSTNTTIYLIYETSSFSW